jgi:hypothetical protein
MLHRVIMAWQVFVVLLALACSIGGAWEAWRDRDGPWKERQ